MYLGERSCLYDSPAARKHSGRDPRELQHIKPGWWESPSITEMLCALAVWCEQIDNHAQDPREEIAFHITSNITARPFANTAPTALGPGHPAHRPRTGTPSFQHLVTAARAAATRRH